MSWPGRYATALCFILSSMSMALAAPAGSAVGVDPQAEVGTQTLVVGQDIFLGDRVQTSSGGRVEIRFRDGTRLIVGPRSAMVIEDYLLRSDGSAGDFAVSALSGTFRFVSGNAAKDRYRIMTPSGTMGIRGTAFDFVVDGRRSTRVLMYSGATRLCPRSGECTEFAEMCELGEMTPSAASSLGLVGTFLRSERAELRRLFPYAATQQALNRDFRLRAAASCLRGSATGRAAGTPQAGLDDLGTVGRAPPPPGEPPPPVVAPPPPPISSGDCAGNSRPNPGNSQNCNK